MINKIEVDVIKNWKGDITKPIVSICCITYNHEKFIEEALDSFLMQETDFPFEIVIDDDCSSDGTADIIRKYKKKFPNIINTNLRVENIGSMNNFIYNMKRAKGKYIALCEGDDYWIDSLKLRKQVDVLENHDDISLVFTNKKNLNVKQRKIENVDFNDKKRYNIDDVISGFFPPTPTIMFKNKYLEEREKFLQKYQGCFSGDRIFTYWCTMMGDLLVITDYTAVYRITGDGVWSKYTEYEKIKLTLLRYIEFNVRSDNLDNYYFKKSLNARIMGIIGHTPWLLLKDNKEILRALKKAKFSKYKFIQYSFQRIKKKLEFLKNFSKKG